jgi:hypothetical protein
MCALQTHPSLHISHVLECPALVEFCAKSERIMYTQGNPTEIQTPANWKLIGRSMTAWPPVLSPSSILLPLLYRCFIPARFENFPSTFLLPYNCASLKLPKSGTVRTVGVLIWVHSHPASSNRLTACSGRNQMHDTSIQKIPMRNIKKPDDGIFLSHRPM